MASIRPSLTMSAVSRCFLSIGERELRGVTWIDLGLKRQCEKLCKRARSSLFLSRSEFLCFLRPGQVNYWPDAAAVKGARFSARSSERTRRPLTAGASGLIEIIRGEETGYAPLAARTRSGHSRCEASGSEPLSSHAVVFASIEQLTLTRKLGTPR